MRFTDFANIGKIERNSAGYLITQARALRTGVQDYKAWEFGDAIISDGFGNDDIVRVYRPEESVKDPESLLSLSHAPITIGHPDENVTSDNWHDLAVGEVSTSAQWDGNFIALPLIIKDKRGIDALESGTNQLSAGYDAEMVRVEHADYDYVMGPPRYNHIAIVDKARAGNEARIGDNAPKWGAAPLTKTERMPKMADMKTVVVGDKAVQVAASDADIITAMIKDHKEVIEAKDAKIAELKIECADTAKKVKTDAEIAKMVSDGIAELAVVTDKARNLVDGYDVTGKDAMTVRREVIAAVYGDDAIADFKTDAEIKAAFTVAKTETKADPVRDAMSKKKDDPKDKSAWDGMYKKKKEMK
jgi:uncharacterized protein